MATREVFILRGIPGSGKTTIAKTLGGIICEADDFFYDEEGNYNFDAELLPMAHKVCRAKFTNAINHNEPRVVVSNTNTDLYEFEYYQDVATNAGYIVHSLVIENRHNSKSDKGVPKDVLSNMFKKLKNSIKLH